MGGCPEGPGQLIGSRSRASIPFGIPGCRSPVGKANREEKFDLFPAPVPGHTVRQRSGKNRCRVVRKSVDSPATDLINSLYYGSSTATGKADNGVVSSRMSFKRMALLSFILPETPTS